MPLSADTIAELAELYLRAEHDATPVPPIRERLPDIGEEEAYAVQAELVRRKLAAGAHLVGRKGGATNPAAQANFGLSQAVYGALFDRGGVPSGAVIELAQLIHPRIECEVAFRMARDLAGPGVTPEAALDAVAGAAAAFEVVDARTVGWGAKMAEMICDNVFQARYAVSEQLVPVAGLNLAAIEVVLLKNGAEAARSTGANVLGSPANALAWLANRLAEHGQSLRAGDLVLAGSLTPLVPVGPGDHVEAVFDELGGVRLSFV